MSERPSVNSNSTTSGDFWSNKPARSRVNSFDPLSTFRSLLKYRWQIMLVTALVTALAIAYVLSAVPLYRSTQSLLLESTESNVVAIENLVKDAPRDEGYVQTRIEMLKSRGHAMRVLSSLGLLKDSKFMAELANHSRIEIDRLMVAGDSTIPGQSESEVESLAIDYLMSRLSLKQVPTTRLVRISYVSSDPELAARIANEVGLQYIQAYVETVQSAVSDVSGWLNVKLEELKITLDDSEARLLGFMQNNQLVDIRGSVGGLKEQELLRSSRELADAKMALSDAGIVLDELKNADTTDKIIKALPSARSDLMIQQTQAEINRLTRLIDRQLLRYGNRHPSIVDLQSELNSLKSDLSQSVQLSIASAQSDYAVLRQQVQAIESRLDKDRLALENLGAKSIKLEALGKEVETNRELYYRFLNRLIETQSTKGQESVNATIAEYATPSLGAFAPKKGLVVGLAFIGALLLSMLAALILNALDDSIKHLTDVDQRLGERLIGIIPVFRKKEGSLSRMRPFGKSSQQKDKDSRIFTEAFTTARTNLILDPDRESGQILLLTSSVPGEGKSMSSIGLARAFAKIERVLLIDADIRRPSIGPALKLDKKSPGLTSYVAGKAELIECIQHHRSGFDVMISGPATSQPLEMLSSSQFENLIHKLSKTYDRIIIDCAPIEAVSDALLLSRLVDQVIYIVKSHDTSVRMASDGLDKLRSFNAPLAGVLLTQVDLKKLAAYGADQEFHGYYDYYGYSVPNIEGALTMDRDELRNSYSSPRSKPTRAITTV